VGLGNYPFLMWDAERTTLMMIILREF